jgi:hypothetical protein
MEKYIEIPGRLGAGKKERIFKINVNEIDVIAENPGMLCIWLKNRKEIRTDLSFNQVKKMVDDAKNQ